MSTRIRLRQGTQSQWFNVNPTLSAGEIGIEVPPPGNSDKRVKFKIGPGQWNSLPYADAASQLDAQTGLLDLIHDKLDDDIAGRDITFDGTTVGGEPAVQPKMGGSNLGDPYLIPSAAWNSIAGRPEVVGAFGRAARDFGIGPSRTAAQNYDGFADAIEWSLESTTEARTLIIPPMNSDEYINLEAFVRLPSGFRMQGAGADSRIRANTKPVPCFIATGQVSLSGLAFEGLTDRAIPNGTFGTHRDNWDAINYSGILLLSGSDGSVLTDIYARNLGCGIAAWGWDENAGQYAGNIQGLTIRGVYARDVWCGVFWREVDFMSLTDVLVQDYSPPGDNLAGDFAAPPHGIYGTSASSLEDVRPMYGARISNIGVRGGRYGSAVSLKHMVGAQIRDITAVDCEGLADVNTMRDCVLSGFSGIDDCGNRAGVDGLSGSVNVRTSVRTLIDKASVIQTSAATSRLLYMDDDQNIDVEVRDFTGVTNYPTTAVQELVLLRGGKLTRPNVKHLGAGTIGRGIRRDSSGSNTAVSAPEVSGVTRPLFDDGASGTASWSYDDSKVLSTNSNGYPKFYGGVGAAFTGALGPAPDRDLLAWSDPKYDVGLDDGAFTYLASGHPVTRTTTAIFLNADASAPLKRWVRTTTTTGNVAAHVDVGAANVDVSIRTRSGSAGTVHGIVLNYLDASNFLTAELRSTGVYIRSVVAGSATDVAQYLFTRVNSRIYTLRALKYGAVVTVWVDGTERISDQSIGSPAQTAYGSSTKHGFYFRDSANGYSQYLRIKAVG